MRIVYLGNNWLGWKVAEWLVEHGEKIVALVVPSHFGRQKYSDAIERAASLPGKIFSNSDLRTPKCLEEIAGLKPDIAVSVLFSYILRPDFLSLFPCGVTNLHPSYLPYNRGEYPNVWSIIENTPAGVTLHYIDEGIDTGDIIAQARVPMTLKDTGETLYRKLEEAALQLFKDTWPSIRSGTAQRLPQPVEHTTHRRRDTDLIDRIDLDAHYTARDLINLLRARTFPPYTGAYFVADGRHIRVRVSLTDEGPDEPPKT